MTNDPVLEHLALLAKEARDLDVSRIAAAVEFAALSAKHLDKDGLSRRAGYANPALMLADLWHIPVAHHIQWWSHGGATDLANGTSCEYAPADRAPMPGAPHLD